tara:strand:- start:20 stop:622 length:603 start_codon:yes stop_codon:yes gene_type:complete
MYIYKTTNLLNTKIYIGLNRSPVSETKNYLGSGVAFKKAFKKYGRENFKKEILEECNSITELDNKERYWISYFNATGTNGYNITKGGYGNTKGMKGKNHSDEAKEKIRQANLGKVLSSEIKEKISESNKGKQYNQWSKESRNKLAESKKGHKHSEETKTKMSNAHKGKLYGPEHIACPHCGKEGKSNAMYRWHFDNCNKK